MFKNTYAYIYITADLTKVILAKLRIKNSD